ncbi:hypothetical protein [Mycobacteroides abscessus]|uniref:hypothetical protein n=1 Tax=Mycobacteroides abscessus TaxID=36809 RepID=UPI0009A576E0|nr:hypothetical protein [Mycobacteroides abscessus]MDO3032217.1 hypothetical protein [Mycobacteroides abscessus subsp. massiliense]SKU70778.1 Uncharacterised protein [Mycobacteroides abscessus subsp. massiliense]
MTHLAPAVSKARADMQAIETALTAATTTAGRPGFGLTATLQALREAIEWAQTVEHRLLPPKHPTQGKNR